MANRGCKRGMQPKKVKSDLYLCTPLTFQWVRHFRLKGAISGHGLEQLLWKFNVLHHLPLTCCLSEVQPDAKVLKRMRHA